MERTIRIKNEYGEPVPYNVLSCRFALSTLQHMSYRPAEITSNFFLGCDQQEHACMPILGQCVL